MKLIAEDHNPVSGVTRQYFANPDGSVTVRGIQDIDPIIQTNTRILNSKSSKSKKFNEAEGLGTKVASIPNIIVEKLLKDKGINLYTCPSKDILKLLNDPDYRKLRTAHGRL